MKWNKKQAEPNFTILTHNICCSVWLNQWNQRVALQSKGPVCETEGIRIWQDSEVGGELDGWEWAREKKENQCYCGKAEARTLWQQILSFQFLQSMAAERQWVGSVVAEFCAHKPLRLGASVNLPHQKFSWDFLRSHLSASMQWPFLVHSDVSEAQQEQVPPGAFLYSDLKSYFEEKSVFWK